MKQGEGEDEEEGKEDTLFTWSPRGARGYPLEGWAVWWGTAPVLVGWGPGAGKKAGADAHQCENSGRLEIGYKLDLEASNRVG